MVKLFLCVPRCLMCFNQFSFFSLACSTRWSFLHFCIIRSFLPSSIFTSVHSSTRFVHLFLLQMRFCFSFPVVLTHWSFLHFCIIFSFIPSSIFTFVRSSARFLSCLVLLLCIFSTANEVLLFFPYCSSHACFLFVCNIERAIFFSFFYSIVVNFVFDD